MAFPCLIYLASVGACSSPPQAECDTLINIADIATGIAHICQESGVRLSIFTAIDIGISYFSISLSLNIILMFMIVTRLILHIKNIRKTIGTSDGSRGLQAIVTILVESYALYVIPFLIFTISWAIRGRFTGTFANIVGPSQVRAVFPFPRCAATVIRGRLIMVTPRSSLRIWSLCESPNGER